MSLGSNLNKNSLLRCNLIKCFCTLLFRIVFKKQKGNTKKIEYGIINLHTLLGYSF